MAQIRRPQSRGVKSAFQNVAPATGGAFRVLAEVAETAYDRLAPAAAQEMQRLGAQAGRDGIKQQIGDNPVYTPQGPVYPPTEGQQVADDTMRALGKTSSVSESLARTESGGNYSVVNSEGFTGKYQWGQARLDDYNRANGTDLTLAQFRANPQAQEAAQAWHERDILNNLGQYVGRTAGGIQMTEGAIIGMAHLGGIGGAKRFIESDGAYNPADSNGTSLADYAKTHGGAGGSAPAFTPTMLRTSDGTLESRLYSPFSGPLLQAHNAAAGVAYQSDLLLKSQADLMGLSQQFALDPEGFNEAAQSYMGDLLKEVPELFKEDIRSTLETEVNRRALGLLDERHRDIRQRADNSSRALMESQSDQLAAAIASGNPAEISAARSQLESTMIARESLPGAAWTREQSTRAIQEAEAQGQARIKKQRDDQTAAYKNDLNVIIKAAKSGLTAANESILDNPAVQQAMPELWREAAANVALRDNLPSLGASTPAQVAAAVADLKSVPVTDDFQIDLVKAAEGFAEDHAVAFKEDPIAAAQTYLPEKPPALPEFDPANPEAFTAALAARSQYAKGLQAEGYTPRVAMLSEAESKTLGAAFGKDTPADLKAVMAGAVVGALGDDASTFFTNLNVKDPVIKHAGMALARGINSEVAVGMLRGQELLSIGQAQKPTNAKSVAELSPELSTALNTAVLMAGGNPSQVGRDIMEAAVALAAYDNPMTTDPGSEEAKAAMTKALQSVLGQSENIYGDLRGGIQRVGMIDVLLPPDVVGVEADAALRAALGTDRGNSFMRDKTIALRLGKPDQPLWGDNPPLMGGQPIASKYAGNAVIVPVGRDRYRLSFYVQGQMVDARTADGKAYDFDLKELIKKHKAVTP